MDNNKLLFNKSTIFERLIDDFMDDEKSRNYIIEKVQEYKKLQVKKKIAISKKKYQEENKDKVKAYKAEKIKCEICDIYIQRNSISKHKKSDNHKKQLDEYNKNHNSQEFLNIV